MKNRIKKIRKEFDLTQREFAERISVKQNTVATYEMGRTAPSDSVISLICKTFNVNEEWLRTGKGKMFNKTSLDEQVSELFEDIQVEGKNDFKKRFIAMLSRMSEPEWEILESKVKELYQMETNERIEREVAEYRADLEMEARQGSQAYGLSGQGIDDIKKEA